MSPEVQKRGISHPTKRTQVLQFFLKKTKRCKSSKLCNDLVCHTASVQLFFFSSQVWLLILLSVPLMSGVIWFFVIFNTKQKEKMNRREILTMSFLFCLSSIFQQGLNKLQNYMQYPKLFNRREYKFSIKYPQPKLFLILF